MREVTGSFSPCTSGAPAARAASGSWTAGLTSYSTWRRRSAASATAGESATTAATRWPTKRTTSSRTRVSSGSSSRLSWRAVENSTPGSSRWVSTRCTPGSASAAAVSTRVIAAWLCGLCSTARWSVSASGSDAGGRSSVYAARPVTTSTAAGGRVDSPTAVSGGLDARSSLTLLAARPPEASGGLDACSSLTLLAARPPGAMGGRAASASERASRPPSDARAIASRMLR